MPTYQWTVFNEQGEKLVDNAFEAANDEEAKQIGWGKIKAGKYTDLPHRVVSPLGHLVLFKNSVYKRDTI